MNTLAGDYLIHALIEAPPQEHSMQGGAWAHYQRVIVRRRALEARTTQLQMPPVLLVLLLAVNTWAMIGILGMLFGPGFWPTIGWGFIVSVVGTYLGLGVTLYHDMTRGIDRG